MPTAAEQLLLHSTLPSGTTARLHFLSFQEGGGGTGDTIVNIYGDLEVELMSDYTIEIDQGYAASVEDDLVVELDNELIVEVS
jgi:hypothetical protein